MVSVTYIVAPDVLIARRLEDEGQLRGPIRGLRTFGLKRIANVKDRDTTAGHVICMFDTCVCMDV